MADSDTTTKVEDSNNSAPEEAAEDLLSLEDLDSIISESDPEFMSSLHSIGPEDAPEIYAEGAGLQYTIEEESALWESGSKARRFFLKAFPVLPRITFWYKIKKTAYQLYLVQFKANFVSNLKNAPANVLGFFRGQLSNVKGGVGKGLGFFKALSLKKKLAFLGLIVLTVATGFFFKKVFTQGLLPTEKDMFIGSLAEISDKKFSYAGDTPMESFYESTRMTQNILLLRKMIVNLKPSSQSGSNPMGAFEFYVEGTVSEVVVEVKDREAEITDLFQRTISDMSFDQVASGEGKQLLCERLRKEMNAVLTQGFIRKVYLKTAIVKP